MGGHLLGRVAIVLMAGASASASSAAPPAMSECEVEARLAEYREEMSRIHQCEQQRAQQAEVELHRMQQGEKEQAAFRDLMAQASVHNLTEQAVLGRLEIDCTAVPARNISLGMLSAQDDAAPADAVPAGGASTDDLAQKLQNPIADLVLLPFQFNWDTGIGSADANKYTVNVQPVIPISLNEDWNIISRTIVPIVYAESPAAGISSDFGLGDTIQSFFFTPKDPVNGWIIGFGPAAQIPTGTGDLFRTKQFSLGPTALILQQKKGWTYGILANHLWRVAGSDDFADVNATFLQPFLSYTFPSATTIGINTESTYNWTASQWTVPINLTVSQLVRFDDQPVEFLFGPRYYAETPDGGPEWGFRFQIKFLFPQ